MCNVGVEMSEELRLKMQELHEKYVLELFDYLSKRYRADFSSCSEEGILAMYEAIKLYIDTERGGY